MAETESHTLFKLVLVLGIMFLLIGALSPGADASWQDFSDTLQNFPTFENPYGLKSFTFEPMDDFLPTGVSTTPLNVRGDQANDPGSCDADENPVDNDWWGCLLTNDANHTYLTTGFGGFSEGIGVNMSVFTEPGNWIVTEVSITFSCKSHGSGITFDFSDNDGANFFLSIGDEVGERSCHLVSSITNDDFNQEPGYDNATFTVDTTVSDIHPSGTRGIGENLMVIRNGGAIGSDDLLTITYVSVAIKYQRSASCVFEPTGNPWDDVSRATYFVGCVLGAIATLILDAITFAVNAAIFAGEIIFWFLSLVGSFITVFGYFFALPGAPPIVQGMITAIFIAIIAFVAFVVDRKSVV